MFENLGRGRQARNFATNVPKILDLKSSSERIFSENWRWVPPHSFGDIIHILAPTSTNPDRIEEKIGNFDQLRLPILSKSKPMQKHGNCKLVS